MFLSKFFKFKNILFILFLALLVYSYIINVSRENLEERTLGDVVNILQSLITDKNKIKKESNKLIYYQN